MPLYDTFYTLPELFRLIAGKQERQNPYALYWADPDREPQLDDPFLLAAPVQVQDDDTELFPPMAVAQNLWILCSDELIQDVVDLAISQKPDASAKQLLHCLNYYINHDTFLDIS